MKKQRMKRLLSVLLAAMMIMAMAVTGFAATGTSTETKGTITIKNAKKDQTYTLYRLLELESYNTDSGAYTYKAVSEWKAFLTSKGFAFDGQDYITNNPLKDATSSEVAAFAKDALKYAEDPTHPISGVASEKATADGALEFNNLELGYYLVDSSLGALCSLNTTANEVAITEKNTGAPDVDKKIVEDGGPVADNSVAIGDTISYIVTINAKTGAEGYVLHDTMTTGLEFNGSVIVKKNGTEVAAGENTYTLITDPAKDAAGKAHCTFEVEFAKAFCDALVDNDVITVEYSATVTVDAVVGVDYKNDAILDFGDDNKTVPTETVSKTYGVNVFKFAYKEETVDDEKVQVKTGLEGAIFKVNKVTKNEAGETTGKEVIALVKESDNVYRKATADDENTITEITTPANGKFTVYGLKEGTYSLEEVKAPFGYNKLAADQEFTITKTDAASTNLEVDVENKTGTILPSTGGIGTTIFYAAGIVVMAGAVFFVVRSRKHD